MKTIFKFVAFLCFMNFEIACQPSDVFCDVQISFSYFVPWIILDDRSVKCTLPSGSDIPYNFDNTSIDLPNYFLRCAGLSVDISDGEVSCRCDFDDNINSRTLFDFDCNGFVYDPTTSQSTGPVVLVLVLGITVPVIILILCLSISVAILLGIILYLFSKKRSARYLNAKRVDESIQMQSFGSCISTTNPCRPLSTGCPQLDLENVYWDVNLNDYDYIDEDATKLSFLGSYRDNSEELYRIIRETKPVSYSEGFYETIEDQITNVRTLSSSKNRKGTISYIIVPTLEQRKSLKLSEYTRFKSYEEYTVFGSEASEGDYILRTESVYQEPSANVDGLYHQMSTGKLLELNRDTITVLEKLGSGEFGEVSRGVWDSPVGEMNVALKVMNQNMTEQSTAAFLQEAAILGQFSHPNVLRLVGVVTLTAPNMIVTELMQEELRRFLLAIQTQHNQELDYDTIAPHFLSFSRQVASGMQHLAERGCIHRDIAARNILLTDRCVCKIADFGMSRRLEAESDYYRVKGSNKVPIKWSAPEAIFFKRFTLKSDVWSYGMLLYEIWSVGRKPWPYEDNRSTVEKIARGANLPPPAGCARAVYELMVSTWHPQSEQRPEIKDIVTRLSESDQTLLDRGELENKRGSKSPAFMLGADPIAAEELYKDLQNKYLNIPK